MKRSFARRSAAWFAAATAIAALCGAATTAEAKVSIGIHIGPPGYYVPYHYPPPYPPPYYVPGPYYGPYPYGPYYRPYPYGPYYRYYRAPYHVPYYERHYR